MEETGKPLHFNSEGRCAEEGLYLMHDANVFNADFARRSGVPVKNKQGVVGEVITFINDRVYECENPIVFKPKGSHRCELCSRDELSYVEEIK